MPSIEVRPFRRGDRDQLAALVNAHAAAVVPGAGVSVAALLSHLERQPGETITDPWVAERATLVAEQQHTVVAAAHLLRYFADERAGASYRGSGDIRWLLFWPVAPEGNPYWGDATEAAEVLIAACLRQLEEWGVTSQDAGGDLPVRGVYGVPEQWPHVRALYRRGGGAPPRSNQGVDLAPVDDLARAAAPPPRPAGRRAGVQAVSRDERPPAVGRPGRAGRRLHRGGDLRGRRAAFPARQGGGHRQPPRHRGLPAAGGRHLAARAGSHVAAPGPGHPPAGLRPAGAGPGRAGRRRLPGVPGRVRLYRAHPDPARLDPRPAGPLDGCLPPARPAGQPPPGPPGPGVLSVPPLSVGLWASSRSPRTMDRTGTRAGTSGSRPPGTSTRPSWTAWRTRASSSQAAHSATGSTRCT